MTPDPPLPPPHSPLFQEHSIHPATSADIDGFITAVYSMMEPALQKHRFVDPEFRIPLALHEAVLNAWRHGNRKDHTKAVMVRWQVGEELLLEVIDQGEGFDFHAISDPRECGNVRNSSGRGIAIITYLAKEVSWRDQGRHLVVSFARTPARGEKPAENPPGCVIPEK